MDMSTEPRAGDPALMPASFNGELIDDAEPAASNAAVSSKNSTSGWTPGKPPSVPVMDNSSRPSPPFPLLKSTYSWKKAASDRLEPFGDDAAPSEAAGSIKGLKGVQIKDMRVGTDYLMP